MWTQTNTHEQFQPDSSVRPKRNRVHNISESTIERPSSSGSSDSSDILNSFALCSIWWVIGWMLHTGESPYLSYWGWATLLLIPFTLRYSQLWILSLIAVFITLKFLFS